MEKKKEYWEHRICLALRGLFHSSYMFWCTVAVFFLLSCMLSHSVCARARFPFSMGKWTIVCVLWRMKRRNFSETDTHRFSHVRCVTQMRCIPKHTLSLPVEYIFVLLLSFFFLVFLAVVVVRLSSFLVWDSCILLVRWKEIAIQKRDRARAYLWVSGYCATVVVPPDDITFHNVADVIVNAALYLF